MNLLFFQHKDKFNPETREFDDATEHEIKQASLRAHEAVQAALKKAITHVWAQASKGAAAAPAAKKVA